MRPSAAILSWSGWKAEIETFPDVSLIDLLQIPCRESTLTRSWRKEGGVGSIGGQGVSHFDSGHFLASRNGREGGNVRQGRNVEPLGRYCGIFFQLAPMFVVDRVVDRKASHGGVTSSRVLSSRVGDTRVHTDHRIGLVALGWIMTCRSACLRVTVHVSTPFATCNRGHISPRLMGASHEQERWGTRGPLPGRGRNVVISDADPLDTRG